MNAGDAKVNAGDVIARTGDVTVRAGALKRDGFFSGCAYWDFFKYIWWGACAGYTQ